MKPKTVGRHGGSNAAQSPKDPSPQDVVGLNADSIILTLDGEKPVSDLCVGDRVITRDSGMARITSVSSRKVTSRAIRILAGSLGHTRPDRDVILPAGQPILIRDWRAGALFNASQAMVPVSQLIDGEFITEMGEQEMTLYALSFARPHVLYVDGLEVASGGQAAKRANEKAAA